MSTKISGSKYAAMYGPTTGDKVRLADTSLVIEVEKDYTTYGDEVKFGGGKTIRDGMGQSVKTCSKDGDLDLVLQMAGQVVHIEHHGEEDPQYQDGQGHRADRSNAHQGIPLERGQGLFDVIPFRTKLHTRKLLCGRPGQCARLPGR